MFQNNPNLRSSSPKKKRRNVRFKEDLVEFKSSSPSSDEDLEQPSSSNHTTVKQSSAAELAVEVEKVTEVGKASAKAAKTSAKAAKARKAKKSANSVRKGKKNTDKTSPISLRPRKK